MPKETAASERKEQSKIFTKKKNCRMQRERKVKENSLGGRKNLRKSAEKKKTIAD